MPKNNKERLDTLKTMQAHAQFCLSGDHTLEAAKEAVKALAKVTGLFIHYLLTSFLF